MDHIENQPSQLFHYRVDCPDDDRSILSASTVLHSNISNPTSKMSLHIHMYSSIEEFVQGVDRRILENLLAIDENHLVTTVRLLVLGTSNLSAEHIIREVRAALMNPFQEDAEDIPINVADNGSGSLSSVTLADHPADNMIAEDNDSSTDGTQLTSDTTLSGTVNMRENEESES